jgi:predicted metalloprotease with PDZ domain
MRLSPEQVLVYPDGAGSRDACTRLISISVGGNPYAQAEELQEAMREKAAELGTDRLFLDPRPVERAFITAERQGHRLLKRETELQMTATACRMLPVHPGFQVNGRWEVERVFPGSHAEAVGLKTGDHIVILNERYDVSNPMQWEWILAKSKVGDSIVIEFLDAKKTMQRRVVELFPIHCLQAGSLVRDC